MTYSFIKPNIKPLFSLFTKIWVIFFAVCLGVIFSVYSFASNRVMIMNAQIESKKQSSEELVNSAYAHDDTYALLSKRAEISASILGQSGANAQLEKVINNLLGFVISSNSIKLESMNLAEKSLEIKGITPTKELFLLLIQTPLRSIFDKHQVSFYPAANGWFKFSSLNTINEDESEEK